jgi:hypothetical protein
MRLLKEKAKPKDINKTAKSIFTECEVLLEEHGNRGDIANEIKEIKKEAAAIARASDVNDQGYSEFLGTKVYFKHETAMQGGRSIDQHFNTLAAKLQGEYKEITG